MMNWVDLAVIGVIALSGVLALVRGFVREALGVAAWFVAALVAYYSFPRIEPWVAQFVNDPGLAKAVGMGVMFILVLLVLSLIASAISNLVRGAGLGGLDGTLGLLFGLARGALVLCVAYILAGMAVDVDQWPVPVLEARSLPIIYRGAEWLAAQVPPDLTRPNVKPPSARPSPAASLLPAGPPANPAGPPANPAGRTTDAPTPPAQKEQSP
jgi:membrane protein required for colicin V production